MIISFTFGACFILGKSDTESISSIKNPVYQRVSSPFLIIVFLARRFIKSNTFTDNRLIDSPMANQIEIAYFFKNSIT